jgi:hypothetical protein
VIPKVIEAKPLEGYKLWLRFQDGLSGTVDLSGELWGPMFEPLKDPGVFAQVSVHPDLDTVTWPNGADFAPEYLYRAARQGAKAPQS